MAYNLGSLRTYVRSLTGVFSTDLLPDTTITAWINEVYFDVARQQEWPWLPVTELVLSADTPAFSDEYRPLLAYRVASKVLISQADQTNRSEQYLSEYASLLNAMYQDDLQADAAGSLYTEAGVQRYVRDLLNIYDDTLTSPVISATVSETYSDLYQSKTWTTLTAWPGATPIPYSTPGVGRALAYGAAARLSPRYGKTAEFVSSMQAEYVGAVAYLTQTDLSNAAATGLVVGGSNFRNTRGWLRNHVKLLTGEYGKNIPDILINDMLNEQYEMLCQAQDWQWLRRDKVFTYPANASYYQLPTTAETLLQPTAPYKAQYVFVVRTNVSNSTTDAVHFSALESEIVHNVPHVLDGVGSDVDYRYEIDVFGRFRMTPTPTEDLTIKARLIEMIRTLASDTTTLIFDDKYATILSYRVAVELLIMSGATDGRSALYNGKADDLYQLMVKDYQLSSSSEPIQLGSQGLITRKYLPWFRVS